MSRAELRVTVWGENVHERENERVRQVYPEGMHEVIAGAIRAHLGARAQVRTATLQEPEHGLGEDVLANTDVLTWWGHLAHHLVSDEVVSRVQQRVIDGMGLMVLHSAHYSKIFRALMGTSCLLRWRENDEREIVWTVNPGHPIAAGVPEGFSLAQQETYGEYFDIPQPDELVFISSFSGGEVFRSGCCFTRGKGRVFYFSPGHETYPIYRHPIVGRIIGNGVAWAGSTARPSYQTAMGDSSPVGWFEAGG